jgi:hypothetical protein
MTEDLVMGLLLHSGLSPAERTDFGITSDDHYRALRGYSYFWIKYVTGFDPRYHCAAGLKCAPNLKDNGYHWPNGTHQFTPSKHILNKHPFEYIYMCGVARTRWADNLHIPMVQAPGEMIEDVTYLGVPILIQNARRLEIPWIEDGWNNLPQLAVRHQILRVQ